MVTFSLSNLTWRGTLRQRRGLALARRLAIACCAGTAVFAALQCIVAGVGTQPVVVAARAIERGAALTGSDVRIVEIPASAIWSGSLSRVDQASGQIAQVPLARGQPVLASMIALQPVIPDGYTTIDVSLASSSGELIAGDIVDLVTNLDCSTADSESADSDDSGADSDAADDADTTSPAESGSTQNTNTDDDNASNDAGNNASSTTGNEAAQQMELTGQEGEQQTAIEPNNHTLNPSTEPSGSEAGQAVQPQVTQSPAARSSATHTQLASPTTVPVANSDDTVPTARQPCTLASAALAMAAPRHNDLTGGTVLSLAMPPEDALAVMAAQETNAIMAVTVAR
ncbi:metal ABC transporter ATPase [Bifidobacterium goeldii]|uniref:Metal ABC transporter ATPase n=1 Tax=Bifidobacterium goeldii TaxID=2306975 RepID=A0A430FJB4_9BIFI|nr:SAF domain-containing protein [Bifidobacterium goeldii]RSX52907.1 metal ABC transporter ATPase [Bifidobacterium goeldii]